ncbi:lithostathine [Rhinolophus sinicus]|uniref:lithostathine n=1 Tax=Rhinolophus sinicus TaxID=89399 RepID=UPI0009439EC8|nr:PREDICTED: lithostathine-like [Rhinolophus sinicus]
MLSSMTLPSVCWMLLSCLMLLSQVQGEDFEKEHTSPRIKCPSGSYAFLSRCYAVFTTPKSWTEANVACQKLHSGNLVSILSGAEAYFVATLVKNNLNIQSNVWIGLHDPSQGTVSNAEGWGWSSNDILDYFAWETDPTTISNPGYCGSLSRSSGYLSWKDYHCYKNLPYICKFK